MALHVSDLIEEFDLDLDDIRWYLSIRMSRRLLTYAEEPDELATLIWRGTLGDELYDMEERFLADLQDQLERGITDEAQVRQQLSQALRARRLRRA